MYSISSNILYYIIINSFHLDFIILLMPLLTDFISSFGEESVSFDSGYHAPAMPSTHTVYVIQGEMTKCLKVLFSQPIVTGSSVLGLKYNGGIILAADTLGMFTSI